MGGCCSSQTSVGRMRRKERKRLLMEALAAEAKTNELLCRIPGRMCTNSSSSNACIFTQQGRKGTNQDAMVVWEGYAARDDTVFCGVFDGHGPFGHLVARRVRDSLPSKLVSIWKARMRGDGSINGKEDWSNDPHQAIMNLMSNGAPEDPADKRGSSESEKEEESEHESADDSSDSPMFLKWRDSFLEAFDSMDKDLRKHPTIDCFCSGTTAVVVLKQAEDLVIGNVGDSRAVLATRTEDNTLEAVQLTVDLKPNLPREAERILKCKGRVFALEDEPEVARVWLPNDDAPGLAMARAFGDFCLKDYGLISVPDVTQRKLTPSDEFVVLATDGIWDVLSNKEVVDIVAGAPTRATAARALVETAVRAWRLKYPNSKVDDCAVVCLYLNNGGNVSSSAFSTKAEETVSVAAAPTEKNHTKEEENIPCSYDKNEDDDEDPSLGRSNTVRPAQTSNLSAAIPPASSSEEKVERSHSVRSLADVLSTGDDEEWSALEGVVRVNSLLHLPRFLKGDKRDRR